MSQPTFHDLKKAIAGQPFPEYLPTANNPLGPVVTDSHRVVRGVVFWALKGDRFDGADFVEEAFRRGAKGVVTHRPIEPPAGCWALVVDDTTKALWDWAAWKRDQFGGKMIAVSGSVGKTTTRQMIHTVLGFRLKGIASPRNYNNHFGVPLSMLALEPQQDYAVLELGASSLGEIDQLARLVRPEIGLITAIGDAHLGRFGSREIIAQAKSELLAALPKSGRAFLIDSKVTRQAARRSGAPITWVNVEGPGSLMAQRIVTRPGELRFLVNGYPFRIPVWGRHHVGSALLAIAVGLNFGLDLPGIAAALAKFQSPSMRCQVSDLHGATVINDAYNASPMAMRAALELLGEIPAEGRRVVVLGDMAELGDEAEKLHYQLGNQVATLCGADMLIACGQYARQMVDGARAAGIPRGRSIPCHSPLEAIPYLSQAVRPGDVVLVKGARFMKMEQILDSLEKFPLRWSA